MFVTPDPGAPAVSVRLPGGDYEHVLGVDGVWNGIGIEYVHRDLNELFAEMIAQHSHAVCEFSLANYLMMRGRAENWLTAIPVFPNRAFRHGLLVTRTSSDITGPKQLEGRRIGVPDYSMSAAVWLRGLLADDYGVDLSRLGWVTGHSQRFEPPEGARLSFTDEPLDQLLQRGDIDAMLWFGHDAPTQREWNRPIRPVIENPEAAEAHYFQRTGIYPINHCVVIREDLLAEQPGLPEALAQAYQASKRDALRRRLGGSFVPWGRSHWQRTLARFDGDPLPYGLTETNRKVVQTLGAYLCDQGFLRELPDIDELFIVPPSLEVSSGTL